MNHKKTGERNAETSVTSHYTEDSASALNTAFLAGPAKFQQQLTHLSDQQYVRLLTLLDEYSAPL
tara:strand:+ start:244 stop:438 length:195 start_codon:yes stop_codon:yes gene_type:complete